jgi:hypothetical protein
VVIKNDSEKIPAALESRYGEIIKITDAFCQQHLNNEYQDLCRKMAATLCRKRPSPILTGKANSWASAIVYSIGRINFLFDKSQTPHMRADELCKHFGLSSSTVSAKSKAILDTLKSMVMDPRWTLPSLMERNPMAWSIMVNGLIVDARHMPREIQEEAFRRGMIPYLP